MVTNGIALVAYIIRTNTPSTIIDAAYQPNRISIPKAPAEGLLLEKVRY